MTWEHFRLIQSGYCKILNTQNNTEIDAIYELHTISTGKQRVFWGRSITLRSEQFNVVEKVAGDTDSYQQALRNCNERLDTMKLRLLVNGNSERYYETALSGSSGYGYIDGVGKPERVSIMDYPTQS